MARPLIVLLTHLNPEPAPFSTTRQIGDACSSGKASGVVGFPFPGGFLFGLHPRNTVLLPPKYHVHPIAPVTVCVLHVFMREKSGAGGDIVSPHLYYE